MESSSIKLLFGSIVGAAVLLIVLALTFQALNVGSTFTETFTVTNPAVDQECDLAHTPDSSTVSVEQYTGTGWEDISDSDVTVDGATVTVDDTALYG